MKQLILYILLFFTISVHAQFEEHFTDGGFNINPHWDTLGVGHIVVNNVLNFQAPNASGKAAIVTAENTGPSVEWSLYLRLGFQPSNDDAVDIVLMADVMDIRNNFNGYFVRIGQDGTNDGLDFYRKDGSNNILLKSMLVGAFQNGMDGNLKVIKNNLGKFVFYWKDATQSNYTAIDSLQETTYYTAPYFGMITQYTTASQDSIWFDDIYSITLPLLPTDTVAPGLTSAQLIHSKQIDVYFDEEVDLISAQNTNNYTLSGNGTPIAAVRDITNKNLVHLTFSTRFASNATCTLSVQSIQDTIGNIMQLQTAVISTPYYAQPNDILINEIMVKPTATMGLPNRQYIELKNTTSQTIRLHNFKIKNANLSDGYIAPNGYAILCSVSDTTLFQPIGNTIGVNGWSTLFSNDVVSLITDDQILIDSITYLDTYYQDVIKQQGGWSLELLQTAYNGSCAKEIFWAASEDSDGGTPGLPNRAGNLIPEDVHATYSLVSNTQLDIEFAKPMDATQVQNLNNYVISNGVAVQSVLILNPINTKARLTLSAIIQPNIIHTFIIRAFSGCLQYQHVADTFDIAITDIPANGEIILNELLFQPKGGGVQFVELYNTTNKLFKIKDLKIAQADKLTEIETQEADLSSFSGYIHPNDYVVLSNQKTIVNQQYPTAILSKMIDIPLPNYDETEDIVLVKNANDAILDKLHYNKDWHFPLLNSTSGVSLERTDFAMPTQQKRNWHSAAEEVGYGTPTLLNSTNSYHLDGNVHIVPEVFSPDGDGIDDEAKITYSFDDPGSVVNVYLYAADGRLANHLVRNETIWNEGVFIWDGNDENGNKKDVGIYFLVFERKTPEGDKIVYKRKCVLAARLN